MDSQQHQDDAGEESSRWAIGRRRKLVAVVVGLMMLAVAFDSSDMSTSDSSAETTAKVTVDEFDRIERLLAATENQRAEGRGPTVEVPALVMFDGERPDFDFDAFESIADPKAPLDVVHSSSKANDDRQPPKRDSFDDLNRITQLQIPDQMALGRGHRVPTSPRPSETGQVMISDNTNTAQTVADEVTAPAAPSEVTDNASVRIVASDVTSSKVTRFEPAFDPVPSERIRFTGTIFPVSRQHNQK